ncbi:hypothetical protein KDE12_01460 [Campylobacter sp. faydin G-105]|uniref:YopX family protein n=1 Tax=Campylobacter anatolicus TaxID=2829105 RepID=UPI001BA139CE|nr:YopX family protein [Campylobacter anatolicus]MBR8461520.1 hypothetical protein [Campylobacter anatolicus]
MKKIKFLAFYKVDKTIYEVSALDFENSEARLTGLITEEEIECPFYDIKLIQYTGLKDKDGYEIYEGDIIKSSTSIGEIIYDDFAFKVRFFDEELFIWEIEVSECGIIGNIFKNPELLEAEKLIKK